MVMCDPMTDEEIVQNLSKIDEAATEHLTAVVGPFAVFRPTIEPFLSQYGQGCNSSSRRPVVDGLTETIPAESEDDVEIDAGACGYHDSRSEAGFDAVQESGKLPSIISDGQFCRSTNGLSTGLYNFCDQGDAPEISTLAHKACLGQKLPSALSYESVGSESSSRTSLFENEVVARDDRVECLRTSATAGRRASPPADIGPSVLPKAPRLPVRFGSNPEQEFLPVSMDLYCDDGIMKASCNLSTAVLSKTLSHMLLRHFTEHTVHIMQPVAHARNPFRTIYFPLAIEGSEQSDDAASSASVATFHGLVSTAAIDMQIPQSENEGLKSVVGHHRQSALIALQKALVKQTSNYRKLMTAILTLVSMDIVSGGVEDHWIHLEAAIRLQNSRHHAQLIGRETRILNSISTMLHLFAQTALPQVNAEPWPGALPATDGIRVADLDPSVEFVYGITTSLAKCVLKTYRLRQFINYYKDQEYPPSLLQACETLGDELSAWAITAEQFATIEGPQDSMVKVARAHARAFHYAAIIYYYRSIQRCDRETLTLEQQAAFTAMTEAEDLKVELCKGVSLPAPVTWPAFIASCDAVGQDRERWASWWHGVQKYQMENFSMQYKVVRSIWSQLDSTDGSDDWRDILAAKAIRIIPV
ncbi:hypothetical protein H2204_010573 [Knufia peltigerae]|uniref:Uncharacterized protein n=1 Tax=Knufia peltigerae TaxID=1002370 RepID=A0AA39CTY9_9EURO|nr:hypothetical protein H2204_010573 [Knufia peltigerae]